MILAFGFCGRDADQALRWFRWVKALDGQPSPFECLLVADAGTPFDKACAVAEAAREAFDIVSVVATKTSVNGWPAGPNALWQRGAKECQKKGTSFLWMEPDAIPLKRGWLNRIHEDYKRAAKSFMGRVYVCQQPNMPTHLMSGIAVYPLDAFTRCPVLEATPRAWDVENAPHMVEHGHPTNLIQHFWGQRNLPPTFVSVRNRFTPKNAFTLDQLEEEAVIFHRNKDGTLIKLLERRYGFTTKQKITIVFPICNSDVDLAIAHAQWLNQLHPDKLDRKAIVAFDSTMLKSKAAVFTSLIRNRFKEVELFSYPKPPVPGWPAAPNFAWQQTAIAMMQRGSPWLWMEADMVALRADWDEAIETEYFNGAMPFMGPHVDGMAHSNGGMIYPADAPTRMPKAMGATNLAWDYVAGEEIMHRCHDASDLMRHIWTVVNGEASQVGGGTTPNNVSQEQASRWIKKSACLVHRIKDESLINLLKRGWRP